MIHPSHQDDRATLYQGEALAVLAELDNDAVDAVITDPPYSSGGMVRGDRAGASTVTKYVSTDSSRQITGVDFTGDNRDQRAYQYWCTLWLAEALRVTRPGGVCLMFTDWRQLPATSDAIQAGGWIWRGIVPWYKPVNRPQLGRFSAACEYVVWGSRGPLPPTDTALPGFYQGSAPRDREHITQKPLEIMRAMVRIVPPGGVILDPFMGAGTTGAAALVEGRRFIGVEQSPHYAAVAERRILTAAGEHLGDDAQDALI